MFSRLRLGVGRPAGKMVVADYVLGRFTPLEENSLDKVLEEAVVKTTEFLKFGTNGVM